MDIKCLNNLTNHHYLAIEELEQVVFQKTYRPGRFKKEAPTKAALMALLAYENQELIAYKIGFELNPNTFYSWVGGVHPQYRNRGFAKQLMDRQHQILKDKGYSRVKTKTRMSYRGMMILNLKAGFDITGLSFKRELPGLVIQLEKSL